MVTLQLGSSDLARTHFAFSPLWECVAAFRAWQSVRQHRANRRWKGFFDKATKEDWTFLRAVALAPSGAIPYFLAPPPERPLIRFADEIEGLRATSPSVIRAELFAAYGSSLPGRPTLAYPARGVAELWDSPSVQRARSDHGLNALVGAGRARVLRRLTRPSTTSELAAVLRMSPAAISQHVTRLRNAGILHRARAGRRVFYTLNDRGHEILRLSDALRTDAT